MLVLICQVVLPLAVVHILIKVIFPPSFQSDSPELSKQEETLLKSSITFLFSSSIPAQTRGDNTESFKYLIYKEKSLLKRDQLMHF